MLTLEAEHFCPESMRLAPTYASWSREPRATPAAAEFPVSVNVTAEASGRSACKMQQGDSFEICGTGSDFRFDGLSVRASVPDKDKQVQLSVRVLEKASRRVFHSFSLGFSPRWLYGGLEKDFAAQLDPSRGYAHSFFGHNRSSVLPAKYGVEGVCLQLSAQGAIVVDLVDLFDLPPARSPPTNAVDVTKAAGATDAERFVNAVAQAQQRKVPVWIPEGEYRGVRKVDLPEGVHMHGAGSWRSVVYVDLAGGTDSRIFGFKPSGSDVGFHDFGIIGDVRVRCDGCPVSGIQMPQLKGRKGFTAERMWLQSVKCGMWLVVIRDNVIRDLAADGINLHMGFVGAQITGNAIRGAGDDGIALWSSSGIPESGVLISSNLVELPFLANGIALYGSDHTTVTNNVVKDIVTGGGVKVGNLFGQDAPSPSEVGGPIHISGNTFIRSSSTSFRDGEGTGVLWIVSDMLPIQKGATITFENNDILDTPFHVIDICNRNPNASLAYHAGTFHVVNNRIKNVQFGALLHLESPFKDGGSMTFTGLQVEGARGVVAPASGQHGNIYACDKTGAHAISGASSGLVNGGGNSPDFQTALDAYLHGAAPVCPAVCYGCRTPAAAALGQEAHGQEVVFT
eukprot:TRINITY_DN5777_c0_g1_i1.p1 TRINITY_DN5777_c0_g1~~TRINITY_DN5777_c0_g1_i1.p1  ORF type:complete len:708 (-),score=156.42 TRINITY_DN5777_c0_g1_i1:228-2099(-)